jgi:hypothetical protein
VFTARYALSPYIKQVRFFFKGLNMSVIVIFLTISSRHRLTHLSCLMDSNTNCGIQYQGDLHKHQSSPSHHHHGTTCWTATASTCLSQRTAVMLLLVRTQTTQIHALAVCQHSVRRSDKVVLITFAQADTPCSPRCLDCVALLLVWLFPCTRCFDRCSCTAYPLQCSVSPRSCCLPLQTRALPVV